MFDVLYCASFSRAGFLYLFLVQNKSITQLYLSILHEFGQELAADMTGRSSLPWTLFKVKQFSILHEFGQELAADKI